MRCRCGCVLTQLNRAGDPIIRNRGIVLKKSGMILVCPLCKGPVPFSLELLQLAVLPRSDRHSLQNQRSS